MARIVGVHGIAQQHKAATVLAQEWEPALRGGVANAGGALEPGSLACAFYGDLFRPTGHVRGGGEVGPDDLESSDVDLLAEMWKVAAARDTEGRIPPVNAEFRGPGFVHRALAALAGSRFLVGLAERALLGALVQVRRYMHEPELRRAARAEVDAVVSEDTRVLIGHSLGSVVAYEALHEYGASPKWAQVQTLVTLGSPLGIPNLIFHRLDPGPEEGVAPQPRVARWTNISDDSDIVALVENLDPLFAGEVLDVAVDNGAKVHDISPYLTAVETGEAVMKGLRGG